MVQVAVCLEMDDPCEDKKRKLGRGEHNGETLGEAVNAITSTTRKRVMAMLGTIVFGGNGKLGGTFDLTDLAYGARAITRLRGV